MSNVDFYLFWIQFKMLFPVVLILGGLFVILFIAHRRYIREVQQLRREIRRVASIISCTYYFTNNKKGN